MATESHAPPTVGPPEGWKARLFGTRFGPVEHVLEIDSTNAGLLARAGGVDAGDGTVLVADYQSAGRGRLGRTWEAPPGTNLLVSVLLRPRWPAENQLLVTPALAIAAVDALAELGMESAVKWPNDLVVEGGPAPGKVAGVLAEYVAGPRPAVIIGLGLNLTWPNAGNDIPPGATSLLACGHTVDRWDLLAGVLTGFDTWLAEMAAPDGPALLRQAHLSRSATVGRWVVADTPGGPVEGTATDIAVDGSLLVQPDSRETRPVAITVGDITHLHSG